VIGLLIVLYAAGLLIVWLVARLIRALSDAAAWKHWLDVSVSRWLDAEDRATKAEFALRDYVRRDRHVGIVYELALDDVQNHPRRADDYNWSLN